MTKQSFQTSISERVSYPLFAIGQNIVYMLVSGYLSLFFTNYIFLSNLAVAQILLFSKVWDAINDPLFGLVVDKVHFKKNKFKPWLRFSTLFIPITTLLIFQIPADIPNSTKIILAFVLYFIWDLSYTVSDVPVYSLLTSMTSNVNERSMFISLGSLANIVTVILLAVLLIPQIDTIGFSNIAIIASVISFVCMTPLSITAKERNRVPRETTEKNNLRDTVTYIKTNKYLLIFYCFMCVNGIMAVSGTLLNYVIVEMLGSIKYLAYFVAIGAVPTAILYIAMTKITRKIDRMDIFKFCIITSALLGVVIYFVGYSNIYLFGGLSIVRTIISTVGTMLSFTFAMDCIEYGNYKTGIRKEGITFSVQTFSNKFIAAISSSFALLILELIKYNGVMQNHQTPQTLEGLWWAYCFIPLIGTAIALPLLFMYKLRCKDVQIMADINRNAISRDEGEAQLSRKY